MSAKKGGLGRGFDSLIPTDLLGDAFDSASSTDESKVSELRYLRINEISPDPDQPRRHFDEAALDELAASIAEHGILQPLVVSPYEKGFRIIAGERRWRASGIAGLDKVPALVRTPGDQQRLELSLIENIQRRDLNALETATAYARLKDQFNLTLEQIGARVGGKSVSAISNTIRLLQLPTKAKVALMEGKLSEGQARPLLAIVERDDFDEIVEKVVSEGWTARAIEQFVSSAKKANVKPSTVRDVAESYRAASDTLATRLNAKVQVKPLGKKGGRLMIDFKDDADLERIRRILG